MPAPGVVADPLRVSVLVGGRRTDLAVPVGLPVAELLPQLLGRPDGPGADPARAHHLVELAGRVLDPESPLEEQGVLPGTVLTVTAAEAPGVVPDDPAEALGAEVARAAAWTDTHRAALRTGSTAVLALLAAAGIVRHPDPVTGGALGLAGTAGLLALATWSSRTGRPGAVSAVLVACVLAAAATSATVVTEAAPSAAWLVAAGPPVGATVVVGALAGLAALVHRRALLLAAAVPGAALVVLGLAARGPVTPLPLLAVLLTVLVVLGGPAPGVALGLVGRGGEPLRGPYDDGGGDRPDSGHGGDGEEHEPGEEPDQVDLADDAVLAADLLGGAVAGVGVLLVAAAPLLAAGGRAAAALAAVLALHVVLRSRRSRAAVLVAADLGAGALAMAGLVVTLLVTDPAAATVLAPVLVLTVPVLLVLDPVAPVGRRRLGDLAETATAVALLPLLVVVTGLLDRVAG